MSYLVKNDLVNIDRLPIYYLIKNTSTFQNRKVNSGKLDSANIDSIDYV